MYNLTLTPLESPVRPNKEVDIADSREYNTLSEGNKSLPTAVDPVSLGLSVYVHSNQNHRLIAANLTSAASRP
jgi:hypothetical protein